MNNGIEEKEVISVERGKHMGTSRTTESEKHNCMQDTDHDEKHSSSSKNKTAESSFEEFNADISNVGTEKSELKTVQWLHGNIKTQYIVNEGFQHVFIMDSTSSTLKLRNCDQLLYIYDEDLTLMPHNEVLELLEKIPLNENVTMIYWRPSSNHVTDVIFSLYLSEKTIEARFLVIPDWTRIKERTVVLNKSGTDIFMQHLAKPSNNIVFERLESWQPHKKPCDFPTCCFMEKTTISIGFNCIIMIRRYSTKSKNDEMKYLHVTDDGDLNLLDEFSQSSDFKLIPARYGAFIVLNEISPNRCLKVEEDKGQFVGVNYETVDKIGDDFRFQLSKCENKCNFKRSF
ncbi:uncharacterized protein LOC134710206 isoform X1 [Mytilus trossulus]|uniref:uncharacterized protein LOC134710206 isoform X1 n=1 Tax=Mytilus trossulus TaxID=6551 RepID=UPI003003B850